MWRWLWLVLLVVCFWLMPSPVLAESSDSVTITAVGYICEAPGGFTVTYINDYEVGLSWTKGEDAVNTMVRARYGSMPEDREDGYLVYYGEGNYATDTGINIDELVTPVYYRAWSQNAKGVWEEGETTGFMEAKYMQLLALVVLTLGLMVTAFVLKQGILYFSSVGAWVILGAYSFSQSASETDIYFFLFLLSMGMALAGLAVIMLSRKKGKVDAEDDEDYSEED